MVKQKKRQNLDTLAGLLVPVSIVIGLGVGVAMHNIIAGIFLGLGVGLILFVAMSFWNNRPKRAKPKN